MRMTVWCEARSITVDGVTHDCQFQPNEFWHVIQWYGDQGHIEWVQAPSNTPLDGTDAALIDHYHKCWQKADKADKAAKRKKEKARKEAEDEAEARASAFEAEIAKSKPLHDAHDALDRSDHEVIKAMELILASEGKLPAGFVKKRDELRAFVRASRPPKH